jgi:Ser/Thr protein kinase RdoA (MazF antagonist)
MTIAASIRESLTEVLAAFGIVPTDIRDIRTGRMNKHWRISDNSRTFALRRYRRERSHLLPDAQLKSIEYEHIMLAHLAGRDWPVAAPIRALDSDTIVEHDDQIYALFPFLEGSPAPYNNVRYLRIKGSLLAHLHADMASAPAEGQRPGFAKIWELDRFDAPSYPAFNDLLRAFGEEHQADARVLRAHRYASLRELSRLGYGELPDAFVHCDYHHDNLLFRSGQLTGLLDFDFLHRDARVVDIAWSIVLDCLEPPAHNAISPAGVAAFVAGYHAASQLDETERALVVPLIRAALVAGAAMRLRQWESGPEKLRLDAPRSVGRTVEHRLPAFESRRSAIEHAVIEATSR